MHRHTFLVYSSLREKIGIIILYCKILHKIICKINDMALLEGADCHKKNLHESHDCNATLRPLGQRPVEVMLTINLIICKLLETKSRISRLVKPKL